MEERGVIPYKNLGQASEGTSWDGPGNVSAASIDDLKIMCAWYDSANPDIKSSYKLPHHEQSSKKAVWNSVSACMGALLGARGGVKIPDADRKGVYNHLAKHYAEFEKDVPEFKSHIAQEIRSFPLEEIRVEGSDAPKITGYAAVFDKKSEDLGGFREVIRRGAFSKTIKEADVRALFNHDPNFVLGRTKSGTLSLEENAKGLKIAIDPPKTQIVRDLVIEPIKRGDIDQMSFGFQAINDKWGTENEGQVRELLEVKLFDISPVTFPAYPQTSVQARALRDEGIDVDLLMQVMIRARDGMSLDEWDIEYLKRVSTVINGYIPASPVPADHDEEDNDEPPPARHSNDVLRMKLDGADKLVLGGLHG
jgi:Escherichia/Staphylococcus phage prohead protease